MLKIQGNPEIGYPQHVNTLQIVLSIRLLIPQQCIKPKQFQNILKLHALVSLFCQENHNLQFGKCTYLDGLFVFHALGEEDST